MFVTDEKVKKLSRIAFPDYSGRKFQIEPFPDSGMNISSYWDGGSRNYFVFVRLDNFKVLQVGNTHPWSKEYQTTNGSIKLSELPIGCVLVTHSYFCGKDIGITVYVRKEHFQQFLPPESEELTRNEKIVLVSCNFKSSYAGISNFRFHKAKQQTGITKEDYEKAKEDLISKGFLNHRGAETIKGKNIIDSFELWDFYKLKKI